MNDRELRIAAHAARVRAVVGVASERNRLGGATATPVECVTTGQTFASPREAAESLGLSIHSVRWACWSRRAIGGLSLRYSGPPARIKTMRMRAVVCVDTGERYDSVRAAARAAGICSSSICKAIRTGKPTGGRRYNCAGWPEHPPVPAAAPRPHARAMPVIRLSDGAIFGTIRAAALAARVSHSSLVRGLRSGRCFCGGELWAYLGAEPSQLPTAEDPVRIHPWRRPIRKSA